MKKVLVVLVVVALVGGAGAVYWRRSTNSPPSFRTAPVKRGDLVVSINATGTVEPEEVVDVGAQVAGKIESFGTDPKGRTIDYGSPVEEGTVLARIDASLYASDVERAQAEVEQAKANVHRAEADLAQAKAKLRQAEQNWKRARELGPSRALSATDYDSFEATYETAKATVAVSEAAVVQAQKTVAQAEATLKRARTNLGYCTIKSPVKGVIIDRRVNIGQTVVASLNAPSLFLIAKDLRRMQVWVAVNEADIGRIRPGLPVSFTVDAFPGEVFRGEVGKVRLNASMTQNVVTYTVEVITDNSSGRLLPYLTANVQFEFSRHNNVWMVPNAALRFKPQPEQIAPEYRDAYPGSARDGQSGREDPRTASGSAQTTSRGGLNRGVVWVVHGNHVRPIRVRVGESDGMMTEVEGDGLEEDLEVIIGQQTEATAATGTTSPFTPQLPRGRGAGIR